MTQGPAAPFPRDPSARPMPFDRVLGALPTRSPGAREAGAAVLIVGRPRDDRDSEILLIERAVRPNDPGSGQVALPGGRVAPEDLTLSDTALREVEEEVGLGAGDVQRPLRYVSTESAHAFDLTVAVFAAALSDRAREPLPRSPEEVARCFWLPSRTLVEGTTMGRETRFGRREVEATVYDGHVLWGFTRRVLRQFFGLEPSPAVAHRPEPAPPGGEG